MHGIRRPLAAAVLALAGGLVACSAEEPFIHSPELIERSHEYFAKERTDRGAFTICYASWETTPEAVRDLAVEECRRFGKRVAFVDSTLQICPLSAPNGANYACLGDGQTLADVVPERERRRRRVVAPTAGPVGDGTTAGPSWAPATDSIR